MEEEAMGEEGGSALSDPTGKVAKQVKPTLEEISTGGEEHDVFEEAP